MALSLNKIIYERRKSIGVVAALVASIIAVVYYTYIPAEAGEVGGIRSVALTYGHTVCWALLAIAAALWAGRAPRLAINILLMCALIIYVLFLLALIYT